MTVPVWVLIYAFRSVLAFLWSEPGHGGPDVCTAPGVLLSFRPGDSRGSETVKIPQCRVLQTHRPSLHNEITPVDCMCFLTRGAKQKPLQKLTWDCSGHNPFVKGTPVSDFCSSCWEHAFQSRRMGVQKATPGSSGDGDRRDGCHRSCRIPVCSSLDIFLDACGQVYYDEHMRCDKKK